MERVETEELMGESELPRLWNGYASAGYERAYRTPSTRRLKKTMGELFLEVGGGTVFDAGCGTGNLFGITTEKIQPKTIIAVDWSKKMLEKAKREATILQDRENISFEFHLTDLTKPSPLEDESVEAVISNLVICYLPGGWRNPLKELYRILKPAGYLYLSTFLKEWDFKSAVRKFALKEFVRSPIATLYGIRFKNIAARIAKESKKRGAEYPDQILLIHFLEGLGFTEIKTIPIYWGFGLALRARKS